MESPFLGDPDDKGLADHDKEAMERKSGRNKDKEHREHSHDKDKISIADENKPKEDTNKLKRETEQVAAHIKMMAVRPTAPEAVDGGDDTKEDHTVFRGLTHCQPRIEDFMECFEIAMLKVSYVRVRSN